MPSFFTTCWYTQRKTFVMVAVLGVALPVFLLAYLTVGQDVPPQSDIILASVLFRHGDRTPTETYPNDPYDDPKYWIEGWGALTKKGKNQLYNLGLFLRNRYKNLLSNLYLSEEIYIVSSDTDRCLMSAELCLHGMYPPQDHQIWNEMFKWQPIPVHTAPQSLDKLIVVKKPCPAYDIELNNTYNSPYIQRINEENKELYEYLTKSTGKPIQSVLDVEFLYNTLEIEEKNNLTLPDWTKSVYPGNMKELATISLNVFTYNTFMKKIKGGPMIGEMVDHMSKKVLNTLKPNRNVFLYSGHDITLVNIRRSLGIEEDIKPELGATLMVELHKPKDGSDHFVKIVYMDNIDVLETREIELSKCRTPCNLTTFMQIMREVVPVDWEKECQNI